MEVQATRDGLTAAYQLRAFDLEFAYLF
jgi:hypothetical protein